MRKTLSEEEFGTETGHENMFKHKRWNIFGSRTLTGTLFLQHFTFWCKRIVLQVSQEWVSNPFFRPHSLEGNL